jgi:hypothetical protein
MIINEMDVESSSDEQDSITQFRFHLLVLRLLAHKAVLRARLALSVIMDAFPWLCTADISVARNGGIFLYIQMLVGCLIFVLILIHLYVQKVEQFFFWSFPRWPNLYSGRIGLCTDSSRCASCRGLSPCILFSWQFQSWLREF